jgi:uncharacterized repeat protein (TIGR03843 family)
MNEPDERDINLEDVDALGAGAIGEPGQREFFIQARTASSQLTVLVEKEQVALLAAEAVAFLDRIADDYPEGTEPTPVESGGLLEPAVPLFRARLIGLGFDPERQMVLIELRERSADEAEAEADVAETEDVDADEGDGFVARIYATRPQVRAMAVHGAEAVAAAGLPALQPADGPVRAPLPPLELTSAEAVALLAGGDIEVLGRLRWASNATLLVTVSADGVSLPAVYKPRRGERPLWDFPTGTLCQREVATYDLSTALGWGLVPETVLRNGPLGEGMVQRFIDHDPEEHYFTLLETHADRFRRFAVFDVLVNNADRKAGHCLRERPQGAILGIDHGLTFHPAFKLRTVIWDFAGEPLDAEAIDALERLARQPADVCSSLDGLLSPIELEALSLRAADLLRARTFPEPDPGYHSLPWPLV